MTERKNNAPDIIYLDSFLPQAHQNSLVVDLVKQSQKTFDHFMKELAARIKDELRILKLSKSKVTLEFDLNGKVKDIIEKYLVGLRYVLIGKAAGAQAKAIAKELNLTKYIEPGIVYTAYLSAIDSNIEFAKHFQDKPDISQRQVVEGMGSIGAEVKMFAEQFEVALRNSILNNLNLLVAQVNQSNEHKDMKDSGVQKEFLGKGAIDAAINKTASDFSPKWTAMVDAQTATASASGAHQAMLSLYGDEGEEIMVVWQTMEDDRVTDFCRKASKDAQGNYRLHKLSSLKPAGWNFGKPKDQWELCIPQAHYNCRSYLIYVPKGYTVERGTLRKL